MADDCVFCAIVDGEIPARVVHEDDSTIAFLDANPLAPGHALAIPRDHHERLDDLPSALAEDLYATLHRLSAAVEDAVDADGTTVAFNNGPAAGQEVPHVHGHVVPRFAADGNAPIHALFDDRPELSDDELDELADGVGDAFAD